MAKTITTPGRLIRNTFFNVLMLMSNAVVAFLMIRFFLGRLGEARYGIWILIGSIFRYRLILGMGLNSAINRRIPMYLAKDDEQGIQKVISTALLFFSIIALVLVLLTVLLSVKIGDWFAIEPNLVAVASLLTLIVGLSFAASTPLQLTTAVLSGLQRYEIISIVTLVILSVRTALLVVLLLHGYGLLTLGLVYGISEVVARGAQFVFMRRLLPRVSVSWQSVDRTLLKEMLFYGVNTFLYATGALIIYRASETIIGIFLGTAEVAQFSVAAAGVVLLWQFLQAFTAAIKPAVSDLDTRDDQLRVKQIAFLTQKYSLLVIIPAGLFLVVMGREFLTVWVGAKFDDPAVIPSLATVLAVLAAGYCLILAQHSNFLVLAGRGEHKVFGLLTAVEAVLCVSCAIFSVTVLGWGLQGIAWSNFVPMALVAGIILPVYFNRKMDIRGWDTIAHVWRPALFGTFPSVTLISVWKHLSSPDSWLELFAVVAAAGGTTIVFSWFVSMETIERRRILSVLGRHRSHSTVQDEVPSIE
jgi:O-antigen/teichoic acid export membrane protein